MFRIAYTSLFAKKPTRGSSGAAGYDLYASENRIIPGRQQGMVDTGVVFQLPNDCYGRIAPRSGLAIRGIDVLGGVCDCDFSSSYKVILINHTDEPFNITIGDRIAQVIFERIYTPEFEIVKYEELEKTERGTNGFGSTGMK